MRCYRRTAAEHAVAVDAVGPAYHDPMCRNITELRGLQPPATDDEIEAAARQFIRKVSGLQKPPTGAEEAYEQAIARVTAEVHTLLGVLPARRQPPATVPPLRRPEVQARIAAREMAAREKARA